LIKAEKTLYRRSSHQKTPNPRKSLLCITILSI